MRTRYDFTAAEGTHFGIIRSIDEIVSDIADPIDQWVASINDMTLVDGKISAWNGRLGRQMFQANPAKRPVYTGNGVRFMDSATLSPNAYLSLAGSQIGARNAMTIATKLRLSPDVLATDLHYLWGWASPICRLMYRYSASNNYLRLQVGSVNLDVDLPAAHGPDMGVVAAFNFNSATSTGTVTLHVAGAGSGSAAITAAPDLQGLVIGGAGGAAPEDMPGWMNKFGAWTRAVAGDNLTSLLAWVG